MSSKHQFLPWYLTTFKETDLIQQVPELENLRNIIEQNDWHNDTPLQQALRLFNWIKQLPDSLLETITGPKAVLQNLLTYLVDPDGHYTTQELLAFAALIHDLGKTKTFQRLPDGSTSCPDHEAVSARMAPTICARFDFTQTETRFITVLVGAHGPAVCSLKKIVSLLGSQQQEQIRRFEADHADHLQPLLLLAWGDMITSHLQTICPEKYEAVLDFYRRWLQSIWPDEEHGNRKG